MKIRPRKTLIAPIQPTPEEQEANDLLKKISYHCKGAKGTIIHKAHCKEVLNLVIKMKLSSMHYTGDDGRRSEKYHYWEKVKSIIEKI